MLFKYTKLRLFFLVIRYIFHFISWQASWGTFRYVLVRLGGLRQARWGSSVLGSVRYVVFSFWLGRCGALCQFWVGRGTFSCD